MPQDCAFQHVDLGRVMHYRGQVQGIDDFKVAAFEYAFEQQDGMRETALPQARGLIQVEQGEAVGCPQRLGRPCQSVTVGIGLDHRPCPRGRRARADQFKVVDERAVIKRYANGAGHRCGRQSSICGSVFML